MQPYTLTHLKNGIRLLTIPRKDAPSASAMVMVSVGARYGGNDISGIAHFIEHNVFKGTKNRSKKGQISLEIESLGANCDAATGHEFTYYYAKSAAKNINKILDIVLDISANMIFPQEDIEIERGNVLEELRLIMDTPTRRLFKGFHEFAFNHQSIGRGIAGTEDTIKSITREQMLDFVHKGYTHENMLVIIAGDFSERDVINQVDSFYKQVDLLDKSELLVEEFTEFQTEPRLYLDSMKTEQAHIALAVRSFGVNDERKYALEVANTILGDGMSSRLFRKIREELGLAYYVGSGTWEYKETGMWLSYAGVDLKRIKDAILAIKSEILALTKGETITDEELNRAKEYIKGSTMLGVETSSDLASWYGFQFLLEKEIISPEQFCERIDLITKADVANIVSELIREDRFNVGILGPFDNQTEFDDLLTLK